MVNRSKVTNLGDSATAYRIDFYGPDGSPLLLPMADDVGQAIGPATSVSGTVPAGGLRTVRTLAEGDTWQATPWSKPAPATWQSTRPSRRSFLVRDPFQASAPLIEPILAARLPFDNRRPFTTVMAVSNPETGASRVRLIARSLDGHERCGDARDLGGMAHDAFLIQDRLACTADSANVLEIQAEAGVAPLSFVFHDFGPFTTNLATELE